MDNKKIAMEILQQMGGMGKIKAMVGATNFGCGEGSVRFQFKMCKKMNIVEVKLNGMDLYDMTFYKYNKKTCECKDIKKIEGIYNDQLKGIFESETGLYLSL